MYINSVNSMAFREAGLGTLSWTSFPVHISEPHKCECMCAYGHTHAKSQYITILI